MVVLCWQEMLGWPGGSCRCQYLSVAPIFLAAGVRYQQALCVPHRRGHDSENTPSSFLLLVGRLPVQRTALTKVVLANEDVSYRSGRVEEVRARIPDSINGCSNASPWSWWSTVSRG